MTQQVTAAPQTALRTEMWPLINSVAVELQSLVQAGAVALMTQRLQTPALFNHMRMAREAHPQPYSIQRFLTRFPYASSHLAAARLRKIVEAGYMTEDDGHYTLTAAGAAIVDEVNDYFYADLGGALPRIAPLTGAQVERINELLGRLVHAALRSNAPSTDRLRQTYNTAQPRDYGPLARLDLHIDDLNAFRDDAHTSAWAAHFAGGRDWETLTLVWRDKAHTAAELAQRLAFRGWEQGDYQASLDALVQRGWLQQTDGAYHVTPAGDALRRRVERDTDDLFYAAWDAALTPAEEVELRTHLTRLHQRLEALNNTPPAATAV